MNRGRSGVWIPHTQGGVAAWYKDPIAQEADRRPLRGEGESEEESDEDS